MLFHVSCRVLAFNATFFALPRYSFTIIIKSVFPSSVSFRHHLGIHFIIISFCRPRYSFVIIISLFMRILAFGFISLLPSSIFGTITFSFNSNNPSHSFRFPGLIKYQPLVKCCVQLSRIYEFQAASTYTLGL